MVVVVLLDPEITGNNGELVEFPIISDFFRPGTAEEKPALGKKRLRKCAVSENTVREFLCP